MHRNELAIKGSMIGLSSQIISLLLKFAVRTFVIRFLGREVLGLDSVLIDTISMLSLAEMGISSAMLYRLYSPVIEGDRQRIGELMATYQRIYHVIALVVALVGIVISLALPWIIKGIGIPWNSIYLAFYLQLACSVCSYLLSYQRLLLEAEQKKHLCILVDLVFNVIFSMLKIGAIAVLRSYTGYLVLNIGQTVFANLFLRQYSRKNYPFIKSGTVNGKDLKLLFQDTSHLLGNKLAAYVYSSTDNLIISAFMGTAMVGTLSNYKYIATALSGLVSSAMSTIQPLLGNYLNSDAKPEDSFRTLQRYTFIRFTVAGLTAVPMITVSHFFVQIWTGNESYVLSTLIPILLACDYYISCVYGPLGEYIIGMGMFQKGKYATYAGTIANVTLSLICAKLWGIYGVLGATVISQLVIWTGDFLIVLKGYYHEFPQFGKEYVFSQIRYFTVVVISALLSLLVVKRIPAFSLAARFILGGIATEAVFLVLFVICFHRREEFVFTKNLCSQKFFQKK